MREQPKIPEEQLRACLQDQYDLIPVTLEFLPRGLDYNAGHVFVIDWDEVMLAPKERDFIFVREPGADAFFQGYGQTEIDWILLTYYLWERVVQDLIECAQNVCFRDDWGEEAKADAAQLFHKILAEEGGNIDAAYAAAAHLAT